MSPVEWQEPKKPIWFERLEPLKKKPLKWSRVHKTDNVSAARKYAWRLEHQPDKFNLPDGPWEFKGAVGDDDGIPGVFARYLGGEA